MLEKTRVPYFASQILNSPHLIAAIAFLYIFGWSNFLTSLVFYIVVFDLVQKWFSSPVPINKTTWTAVIVGAGPSGICMAKRFKDVGIENFVILEKSDQVGGAWNDNRYPGIACDVPAHYYSYSFHLNPFWSRAYAGGTEIREYFQQYAQKLGLQKNIRFGVEVSGAKWDSKSKEWIISTKQGEDFRANFFIRATGPLHVPKITMFKNEENCTRSIVHARLWNPDIKLDGKRVAVIGTGATGVQIVPAIADSVKKLYLFQRTPAWAPKRGDFEYKDWMKQLFNSIPWLMQFHRYGMFWYREFVFHNLFTLTSPIHGLIHSKVLKDMKAVIGDDLELQKKLIPDYDVGCKRITVTDSYLEAFKKPNVNLITDSIDEFTPKGIRTKDGTEHKVDVIIKATGFDLIKCAKMFPFFGTDETECGTVKMGDEPRSYLGVTAPGFPNMFILIGPNSGLAHSSIIFMIETQVNYIIECVRTLSEEKKSSMEVKEQRLNDFVTYVEENMKNKSFASATCSSYYKNEKGANWGLWSKDLITYWLSLYSCNSDDYIMQ